jgi:hypothetical protein
MKTENCREWRESLGAYALGQLAPGERVGLEAHLEGCPSCRAELQSLSGVAALLPHADPERFGPAPQPPVDLGKRIFASFDADAKAKEAEIKTGKRRRQRRRFGFGFAGGLAATAAAVVALVILPSGGGGAPEQHVEFSSLPSGVKIAATLEPHGYGTEIRMYVSGVRSGTLCRVFLTAPDGTRYPAGSFRYRWGEDSEAELSSALDLSRTAEIGVHAGGQTFTAPVDGATATTNNTEEDAT